VAIRGKGTKGQQAVPILKIQRGLEGPEREWEWNREEGGNKNGRSLQKIASVIQRVLRLLLRRATASSFALRIERTVDVRFANGSLVITNSTAFFNNGGRDRKNGRELQIFRAIPFQ